MLYSHVHSRLFLYESSFTVLHLPGCGLALSSLLALSRLPSGLAAEIAAEERRYDPPDEEMIGDSALTAIHEKLVTAEGRCAAGGLLDEILVEDGRLLTARAAHGVDGRSCLHEEGGAFFASFVERETRAR